MMKDFNELEKLEKLSKSMSEDGNSVQKPKSKMPFIIIGAVVLVAIIVGAILISNNKAKKEESKPDTIYEEGAASDESNASSGDGWVENAEGLEPVKVVVKEEEDGWIYYDVYVKNTSDMDIHTISVDISYMDDDENIVGSTYPQVPNTVSPGKSIVVDGLMEVGEGTKLKLDGFSYYGSDGNFYQGKFDAGLDLVDVTKPNTKEF